MNIREQKQYKLRTVIFKVSSFLSDPVAFAHCKLFNKTIDMIFKSTVKVYICLQKVDI